MREIYAKCGNDCVASTQDFKECMQLLEFQSQVKLVETIQSALKVLNSTLQTASPMKPFRSTPTKNNMENIRLSDDLGQNFIKIVRVHMVMFLRQIESANTETAISTTSMDEDNDVDVTPGNRYKLKEVIITEFTLGLYLGHSD